MIPRYDIRFSKSDKGEHHLTVVASTYGGWCQWDDVRKLIAERERLREACATMLATWCSQDEDGVIASRNLARDALRQEEKP